MLFSHHIPIKHATKPVEMLPFLFPQEKPKQHTSTKEYCNESYSLFSGTRTKEEELGSLGQHILSIYEPLYSQFTIYTTPKLNGKGKMPKTHTFQSGSYKEWNIDGLSVGKIRQIIDQVYTEYKLICMRKKSEIESYKTLIKCFTDTLQRWWEVKYSPKLLAKMEEKFVKDEAGDVIHNENGDPQK